MGDIVSLPRRGEGELVWVCACGSTTHYHHADGRISCGSCDAVGDSGSGEWRLRFPEEPADPKPLDASSFKVTDFASAEVFLKRQIKTAAGDRPIAAAVVLFEDGSFSTFGDQIDSDDRRAWLLRKLADAGVRMTGRR